MPTDTNVQSIAIQASRIIGRAPLDVNLVTTDA
jgi:hypothetical protein